MGGIPTAHVAGDSAGDPQTMDERKLKGIYSLERTSYLGTGATRKKSVHKAFWAAWEYSADSVQVQALNSRLVPAGPKRLVPIKEFESAYKLEPDYFIASARPKSLGPSGTDKKSASIAPDTVDSPASEAPAPTPEPDTAAAIEEPATPEAVPPDSVAGLTLDADQLRRERRVRVAAALDEKGRELERTARIAFDIALTHLKHGNTKRAHAVFEEVVDMEGDFRPPHKHMFNEFGIGLRKNKLPQLALKIYKRALKLSPRDEHLLHNIARLYYEMGDMKKALEYLEKSLDINPALVESEMFWEFIMKRHMKQARKRFEI